MGVEIMDFVYQAVDGMDKTEAVEFLNDVIMDIELYRERIEAGDYDEDFLDDEVNENV